MYEVVVADNRDLSEIVLWTRNELDETPDFYWVKPINHWDPDRVGIRFHNQSDYMVYCLTWM